MYRAGIVTLSDKGAAGEREDKSGAVIKEILESAGYEVVSRSLLPDEGEALKTELIRLSDQVQCDLVLTTGGTGFSRRECSGNRGGDSCLQHDRDETRHAEPRCERHPRRHADYQSSGKPEGGPGEPGIRAGYAAAWFGHPVGTRRRVRQEVERD